MKNQKNFRRGRKYLPSLPGSRVRTAKARAFGTDIGEKKSREDLAALPGENLIFSGGFLGDE